MNAWRKCKATQALDESLGLHHNLNSPASFAAGRSHSTASTREGPRSSRFASGQEGVRSSVGGGGVGDREGGFGSGLNVLREDGESPARFAVEPRVHDVILPALGLLLRPKTQRVIANQANTFEHQ